MSYFPLDYKLFANGIHICQCWHLIGAQNTFLQWILKEKKEGGGKMALLLTKVKPRTGPTNVEIHNGSNTHVDQSIDPLDHKHDDKRHNGLWKQ